MEMIEKIEDAVNELGWKMIVYHDTGEVEFENYSPAGEDIIVALNAKDLPLEVLGYTDSFDVDEHVALWLPGRGKNGCPGTCRELVEDAEAIQRMLYALARAVVYALDEDERERAMAWAKQYTSAETYYNIFIEVETDQHFAETHWTTADIIGIANYHGAEMSEEQALDFWEKNERAFLNCLIEHGNEVLDFMLENYYRD